MQPHITWQWQEDFVDPDKEHIEIRYGDASQSGYYDCLPIALIGRPKGHVFPVRWLVQADTTEHVRAIQKTRWQLTFYLVEKGERDPWLYAQYHCTTCANMFSAVHWTYFPSGRGMVSA